MFNGVSPCDRQFLNSSRVVCRRHGRDVFSLANLTRNIYSYKEQTRHIAVLATQNNSREPVPFVPFPFKFVPSGNNASPHTYNGHAICLDTDSLVNCVSSFITSKNLVNLGYSARQIQYITEILVSYIQDQGYVSACNSDTQGALNFQMFKAHQSLRLQNFWAKPRVLIHVVTHNQTVIKFPIDKLPTFYQAILMNFEVSEHNYDVTSRRHNSTLIPNCIANTKIKMIATFHQSSDLEICRYVPGADFVTPLVLSGKVTHNAFLPYEQFMRPMTEKIALTYSDSIPRCQ